MCRHISSSTPSLWNTFPSLFLLSPRVCLGDADLSCRILEKTLVGSGLLDTLRERLGFSLLLRSPFLFGVLDSEYCDLLLSTADDNAYIVFPKGCIRREPIWIFKVCSFSLPTVFRTADVGGVRLSSVGPLM
ncbi:hypothetical protein Tco_0120395, partial [Tanacetum coccineum]